MNRKTALFKVLPVAVLASAAVATSTIGALVPMGDDELATVDGQAIIQVDQLRQGIDALPQGGTAAYDFVKITTGLEVELNANARRITLGNYDRPSNTQCNNATRCFADIDIEYMSLGTVDPATGQMNTVNMIDPYIEFAFDTVSGQRQLKGLRIGAAYQEGILAGANNVVSGNIEVVAYPGGALGEAVPAPTLNNNSGQGRSTNVSGTTTLPIFGSTTVTNDLLSAPKLNIEGQRNFWLALSDSSITYPNYSCNGPTGCENHATALSGFYLNLADNVTARDLRVTDDSDGALGVVFGGDARFYNQFPVNCWNGKLQAIHTGQTLTSIIPGVGGNRNQTFSDNTGANFTISSLCTN